MSSKNDISVKREAVDVDPFAVLLAPTTDDVNPNRNSGGVSTPAAYSRSSPQTRGSHENRSHPHQAPPPPQIPKTVVDTNYFTEKLLSECR